jgi:hypothetical protein
MRKMLVLASIILVILADWSRRTAVSKLQTIERKAAPGLPAVSAALTVPEDAVSAKLRPAFVHRSAPVKFGQFLLSPVATPASQTNPLREYAALEASSRNHDFYFMPPYATPEVTTDPQDYYWDSEYYCNDRSREVQITIRNTYPTSGRYEHENRRNRVSTRGMGRTEV